MGTHMSHGTHINDSRHSHVCAMNDTLYHNTTSIYSTRDDISDVKTLKIATIPFARVAHRESESSINAIFGVYMYVLYMGIDEQCGEGQATLQDWRLLHVC